MKIFLSLTVSTFLLSSSMFAQAGAPDPSFSTDGFFLAEVDPDHHNVGIKVALQADGKILAGVSVYGSGIEEHIAILRYLPDGTPDNTYNGNAPVIIDFPEKEVYLLDMKVMPDGKLLVCANLYNLNNAHYTPVLFRFNTNGTPDSTFGGATGKQQPDIPGFEQLQYNCLHVQTDGKIVIGGYALLPSGVEQMAVFRYLADGTPDAAFSGDGLATATIGESYVSVSGITSQSDGKILIAGTAVVNNLEDFAVVRFNMNGTSDVGFNGDGIGIFAVTDQNDRTANVGVQADGKIVLGGTAGSTPGSGGGNFAVLRLTMNGNPDPDFSDDGIAILETASNDGARDMLLQPDGKILLGGFWFNVNSDFAMARFRTNGVPDNTFGEEGIAHFSAQPGNSDEIYALALQPDGKILAAGFARVGNTNSFALARFISGILVDTEDAAPIFTESRLYPNPVVGQAQLEYTLSEPTEIRLDLYDTQGRLVQNLHPFEPRNAGKQKETFHLDLALPPGIYFLEIESETERKHLKMIKN